MYSDLFCRIYNEFGWNYFPEAFAGQILEWLTRNEVVVSTSIDLACGTGILAGILSRSGIDAEGMDFSEGMIKAARENYPNLKFVTADMITFKPEKTYDLVTCTGDALNHIMDLKDVRSIFRNVHDYLNPGGYFIFDILSEQEGQEVDAIPFEYNETVTAEFSIKRNPDGRINLRTKVFENGKFLFEENIFEKIHDPAAICRMLEQEGFVLIRCADRLLPDSDNPSTTCYVIARKPGSDAE